MLKDFSLEHFLLRVCFLFLGSSKLSEVFLIFHDANNGQGQIEAKTKKEMGVQDKIREQTLIDEIKHRPNPHGDIQQKANDQTSVIAFTGFNPQGYM